MKLNWCCKLGTAPNYGEFSCFSILLQVPSKLWRKCVHNLGISRGEISLKKYEKLYFKDIRENSVVSSIFQRTGVKVQKKTHKTPHLNYNHIFWPVNYGVISFPWMWYMPIEDLIWYLALRNNLYIFPSLHWIKIFLTATITDLSDGWRCSMKVNISSRIKEIGPVLVLLRKVNDH